MFTLQIHLRNVMVSARPVLFQPQPLDSLLFDNGGAANSEGCSGKFIADEYARNLHNFRTLGFFATRINSEDSNSSGSASTKKKSSKKMSVSSGNVIEPITNSNETLVDQVQNALKKKAELPLSINDADYFGLYNYFDPNSPGANSASPTSLNANASNSNISKLSNSLLATKSADFWEMAETKRNWMLLSAGKSLFEKNKDSGRKQAGTNNGNQPELSFLQQASVLSFP